MTDLVRRYGKTYADEWQVVDATTGAVLDISSGYTFVMHVNPERYPASVSDDLFTIVGAVSDGPNGLVEFAPQSSDVVAANRGQWYYHVELTKDSRTRTLDEGRYTIK